MQETDLMDVVYSMYEGDVDDWSSTSDEYLAARRFANAAITMWENYDNTRWNELFSTLTDAADGDKTTTAGDYSYNCPTNFKFPCSYVRTINNSDSTYYSVLQPTQVSKYDDSSGKWCYFTGNEKDGYDLHFNPGLTLTTGDTISYEYYKSPTSFTTTTSVTELKNPYFIIHYTLWRMYKNDGEDNRAREEFQLCQQLLEQMRVDNMSGFFNVPYTIETDPESDFGFGT